MKQCYVVPAAAGEPDERGWQAVPPALVEDYPWDETGYCPAAAFRAVWTPAGLAVRWEVTERVLQVTRQGLHPRVCDDSAVEFFLMPAPERDGRYINLECNPLCAMYVGAGTGRADNVLLKDEPLEQFCPWSQVVPAAGGLRWVQRMFVPFAFLRRHSALETPASGTRMRANLYKIAESGPSPHFGCWSHIDWPQPDFHRPEFFGDLILG